MVGCHVRTGRSHKVYEALDELSSAEFDANSENMSNFSPDVFRTAMDDLLNNVLTSGTGNDEEQALLLNGMAANDNHFEISSASTIVEAVTISLGELQRILDLGGERCRCQQLLEQI